MELNNLSKEKTIDRIRKEVSGIKIRSKSRNNQLNVSIIYHSINNVGSFYTIANSNLQKGGICYYTSLEALKRRLFKSNFNVKKILVSDNYTLTGGVK